MKLFTNLPGLLRPLFGFLRIATLIMAVFWGLNLTFNTWIQKSFGHDARLIATVGEISLPNSPDTILLDSDTATSGSLHIQSLRGTLQVDLANQDAALVSAIRRAIFPTMAVLIIFSYIVFTALRNLCRNLERGEVFTDENLRLVRKIGLNLTVYSLISGSLEVWASHVLGGYFHEHVTLTGLQASLPFAGASTALQFKLSAGLITTQGGVLIGLLVLVVAEAFRQGLQLKSENDLTV